MVRFVPGLNWTLNPGYLKSLRGVDPRAAAALDASPGVLDALRIEVDGVPLGGGIGEGDLFAAVDELVAATLRLCREPAGGGQIPLGDGDAELVLGRRGERACLAIVSLARPARLLSAELEVDPFALARAVASCADAVCRSLRSVNASLAATPLHRRLVRGARALRKAAALASGLSQPLAPALPLRASPAREASGGLALCVTLHDDHGRIESYRADAHLFALLVAGEVCLVGRGGHALARFDGPPFLALTELARAAKETLWAARAGDPELGVQLPGRSELLRLSLRDGRSRLEDEDLAATPLALCRAFLDAALDFTGALCARNAAFAKNPYLCSLADGARESLRALRELEGGDLFAQPAGLSLRSAAQPTSAPLSAHGALKRLRYEVAWRAALPGGPARSLCLRAGALSALGDDHLSFLDARTGAVLAAHSGRAAFGPAGALLCRGNRLEGLSEVGRTLWLRELTSRGAAYPTASFGECLAGPQGARAALFAFDDHRLAAVLCETGRIAWEIAPPQVLRLVVAARGDRVFAAADTGVLYALDARTGAVAFRVRTGLSPQGGLWLSSRTLAFVGKAAGELWLLCLDSRTGRPRFKVALALDEASATLGLARQLVVAGARRRAPVVLGFGLAGRRAFDVELAAQGGAPAVTRDGARLYLAMRDSAAWALSGAGSRLWSLPGAGSELARPLPPQARRGVLIVPGDPARALDPATGATLAELPPTPGLLALIAGPRLELFAADDDGVVTCLRMATHLSVVG
jgi:hypothetical protein